MHLAVAQTALMIQRGVFRFDRCRRRGRSHPHHIVGCTRKLIKGTAANPCFGSCPKLSGSDISVQLAPEVLSSFLTLASAVHQRSSV